LQQETHRRCHATQSGNTHQLREDLLKFSAVPVSNNELLKIGARGRRERCAAIADFLFQQPGRQGRSFLLFS
jgi:hypothetical protein